MVESNADVVKIMSPVCPAPMACVQAANETAWRHAASGGVTELLHDGARAYECFTIFAVLLVVEPLALDTLFLCILELDLVKHVGALHSLSFFLSSLSNMLQAPTTLLSAHRTRLYVESRRATLQTSTSVAKQR